MHAVGEVDMDLRMHYLVNRSGAEMLAWIAELLHTTMVTNIRIADNQVYRLIVLVTRACVVDIRQLVEGEFSVALGRSQRRFPAVGRSPDGIQVAHMAVTRIILKVGTKISSPQHLLDAAMQQAGQQPVLKSLMEIAYGV